MGQLYVCLLTVENDKEEVFHTSLVEGKGREITVGTSRTLERGQQLYMVPVPPDWDGTDFTPDEVRSHRELKVANVSRAEGRGRYRLTCMADQDQQMYLAIHSGFIRDDEFELDTWHTDGITTICIKGRVGFGSAGKVKAVLDKELRTSQPILLDMRETQELSSLGMATINALLRDMRKYKSPIALLVDPRSRIMRTLTQTRMGEVVKIFSKPELALTVLKRLAGQH